METKIKKQHTDESIKQMVEEMKKFQVNVNRAVMPNRVKSPPTMIPSIWNVPKKKTKKEEDDESKEIEELEWAELIASEPTEKEN